MAVILLDADVIIRGEKGTFDLKAWLERRPDETFEVAAITVAELWHGVERAGVSHRARRQQYLNRVLAPLTIVPYTEHTAYEHARIWAQLEASGTIIGPYDLVVAATALERSSQVATFNKRHFQLVPGLVVIEPQ
jgi:predicted nucleic acid-binding protein